MVDDKKWLEMAREYTSDSFDSLVVMVGDEDAIAKLYVWTKKALVELEAKEVQLARLEKAWPCGEDCATRSCRYCGVVPGNHHAEDCFYTRNNYGRWVSAISFGPCNCDRAAKFGKARDG